MTRIVPGFAAARERGRVKFAWARGLRPFRATSSAKPVGRIGRTGIDVPDGVTAPVGAYDVPAGRLETDQPRPIRLEPGLGRRREAGVGRAGRNAGRERCKERRSCCCRDQPQWPSHRPLPFHTHPFTRGQRRLPAEVPDGDTASRLLRRQSRLADPHAVDRDIRAASPCVAWPRQTALRKRPARAASRRRGEAENGR